MGITHKPRRRILAIMLIGFPFPSQVIAKTHKMTGYKKCRQNTLANAVK